jgi:hypothetical protein
MTDTIATPAEVEALPPGQWVWDANGTPLCLVDTYVGWPQRMWMDRRGGHFVIAIDATDLVAYPLTLAEPDEPADACQHARTQEMGHCLRCGRVVADPRTQHFAARDLTNLRAVLAATTRKDPA